MSSSDFLINLAAGGMAGTSVDVVLFPLDTIKTRLQSPQGFFGAGGFRGIYNGLSAAAAGSAPTAALFFCAYEGVKKQLAEFSDTDPSSDALAQIGAASFAETVACLIRVPTEVVKQRMQTGKIDRFVEALPTILRTEGVGGLYSGFGVTVMREIPFASIQFPIYESLKVFWSAQRGKQVEPYQAALCGSAGGAVAAAVTTPLDVVKTRLMLGEDANGVRYKGPADVVQRVMATEGWQTMFAGIKPRVMWISIGGFVFFGSYEAAKSTLGRLSK